MSLILIINYRNAKKRPVLSIEHPLFGQSLVKNTKIQKTNKNEALSESEALNPKLWSTNMFN